MIRSIALILCLSAVGCGPKQRPEDPAAQADPAAEAAAARKAEADAVAQRDKDADRPTYELVNEAVALMKEGAQPADIQKAIAKLRIVQAREPENALVRLNLGVARHRLGDTGSALREYQAAVGQDPTLGGAWLHIGQIALEQGRKGEAESTWRAGIRKAPDDMDLRVALIDMLRSDRRLDDAIAEAKAALAVNANSVEVYNAMGLCWQDKGDLVLARFVYQKALAGIPGADDNAWLHLNLGWTWYLDSNTPAAVKELERALELDPYLVPALVNLSRIYMDDRNYGDTVALLERARTRAPKDPGVHMNLGIAYRGVGRYQEAEKEYREVLQLAPSDPSPWLNLGILFGDYTKDYDASVDAFQQYIAKGGPDRSRAEEYMDLVQKEKKRVEKRAKAEEERKQREAERAEQKRLLKEAEKKKKDEPAPAPAPESGADGDKTEDSPPAGDNPWGER